MRKRKVKEDSKYKLHIIHADDHDEEGQIKISIEAKKPLCLFPTHGKVSSHSRPLAHTVLLPRPRRRSINKGQSGQYSRAANCLKA